MTRQPDDPGVDHEREGTRLNQHGDPVMPWDEPREPSPLTVAASVAVGGSAFALLIWWLT